MSRIKVKMYHLLLLLNKFSYALVSGVNAPLPDHLNPLAPPSRSDEGIREILSLVHHLTIAELHNAHRVCWSPLVGDGVFRNPEIALSEHSPDVETRRFAGMMTPQCLQIASPEDALA